MGTTIEEGYQIPSWTKESGLSLSDYSLTGGDYRDSHCRLPNPFTSTSSPSQNGSGDIGSLDDVYPDECDSPFPVPSLNGHLQPTPDLRRQNLSSLRYHNDINHTNIWQAAHSMHNTHDFVNVNRTNTATKEIVNSIYEINPYQSLPTSAFTEALFRMESADTELQDISTDQAQSRSGSPLLALAAVEGQVNMMSWLERPETTGIRLGRHASDSTPGKSISSTTSRLRNQYLGTSTGASVSDIRGRSCNYHLASNAGPSRVEAAERYDQGDKRRAQNMLAQRAFRARNKIVQKNATGHRIHLEELIERQAECIGNLTDMVRQIRKENHELRLARIKEL